MFQRILSTRLLGTFVAGVVCLTLAGQALASPLLPGLTVHLRADQVVVDGSGNVTQWTDLTGNGFDATPSSTAPVQVPGAVNGLPVIRFGGGDRRLNLPTLGVPGEYEVFVVARTASTAVQFLASGATIGHYEAHLNGSAGSRFIPNSTTFADLGAPGQFANGQLHAFNFRVEGTTGYNRVNGFQSLSTVPSAQSNQGALLSLGIRAGENLYPFVGDMAEVLIYASPLTPAERGQVDAYLASTWGVSAHGAVFTAPANGHSIRWDGVSGPQSGVNDVPDNLARESGVTAFGSSQYGGPHQIAYINDGRYGNDFSWLANFGADPNPYVGVDLGELKLIDGIAWGRSNTNSHQDRWEGSYTLQYTQVGSPAAAAETGNASTGWANIGTVNLGGAPQPGFVGQLRHEFELGTLLASGVRIKPLPSGNAIDELELYEAGGYQQAVFQAGARGHWRLGEPAGSTVARNIGRAGDVLNGSYSAPKIDRDGLIRHDADTAAYFNAAASDRVTGAGVGAAGSGGTNVFAGDWTIETWFVRDAINNTSGAGLFSQNQNSAPIFTFGHPGAAGLSDHHLGIMNAGLSWGGVFLDLGDDYLGKRVYAVMTKTGSNAWNDPTDPTRISIYARIEGEDEWLTLENQPINWNLTPGNSYMIGRHSASHHPFLGAIDEVAIYDYALDFATMHQHFVLGIPEPSSAILLAVALAVLGVRRRRR